MSEWYAGLETTLDHVWQTLSRATADRRSPARTPVLATTGADGVPDARVVVLRSARRSTGVLEVYTDNRTKKVKDLEINAFATFCVWLPKADLQIRIKSLAVISSGADVLSVWQSLSASARRVYGGVPAPGALLARPSEHGVQPDPAVLTVLSCQISEIETLHLGRDLHRRARFRREDDWEGAWCAP